MNLYFRKSICRHVEVTGSAGIAQMIAMGEYGMNTILLYPPTMASTQTHLIDDSGDQLSLLFLR
jgi:hypothetical protein